MKKKQFVAFLLSGLLVLNTAIPAFAEGMTEQTAETYKVDITAPKLTSVSIDKEEVKAPGTITATLQVEEENGLEETWVIFKNEKTGRTVTGFSQNNLNGDSLSVDLNISEYEAEGVFELSEIQIEDKAGNRITYSEFGDEELPKPIPSFTVRNDTGKTDITAPVVTAVSVNKNEVEAPGTITATLQVEEENGLEETWVIFKNEKTGRTVTGFSRNSLNGGSLSVDLNISEYETEGLFELSEIQIEDKAGNRITYSEFGDEELPKPIPSFTVRNDTGKTDITAPVVTAVSVNKNEVEAPGTITATLQVEENGLEETWVIFKNEKTGRTVTGFSRNNLNGGSLSVDLNVSEYETEGLFELSEIQIEDKAGNRRTYSKNGVGEELPKPVPSFTVINDDELVPGQSENRPSKPERPSKPNNSGSSSGAIVNYDSEKPDPADKKATEMYNFWQNVKRKIKNTEEGKTLRVAVPAEYTYMPASVMETLRLNPQVSLKLSWGKDTIVIKAGTAQPKQKLKAYWTKSALLKLYPQK